MDEEVFPKLSKTTGFEGKCSLHNFFFCPHSNLDRARKGKNLFIWDHLLCRPTNPLLNLHPLGNGRWFRKISNTYTTDGFSEFCRKGGSLNWKCKCMGDDMEDMGISDLELPEGENKSAKAWMNRWHCSNLEKQDTTQASMDQTCIGIHSQKKTYMWVVCQAPEVLKLTNFLLGLSFMTKKQL